MGVEIGDDWENSGLEDVSSSSWPRKAKAIVPSNKGTEIVPSL
jgi:hypothetical protein